MNLHTSVESTKLHRITHDFAIVFSQECTAHLKTVALVVGVKRRKVWNHHASVPRAELDCSATPVSHSFTEAFFTDID